MGTLLFAQEKMSGKNFPLNGKIAALQLDDKIQQ